MRKAFEESVGERLRKVTPTNSDVVLQKFTNLFSDDIPLHRGTIIDLRRTTAGNLNVTSEFRFQCCLLGFPCLFQHSVLWKGPAGDLLPSTASPCYSGELAGPPAYGRQIGPLSKFLTTTIPFLIDLFWGPVLGDGSLNPVLRDHHRPSNAYSRQTEGCPTKTLNPLKLLKPVFDVDHDILLD